MSTRRGPRGRAAIAAIGLAAVSAGFVVASNVSGEPFSTVGTIAGRDQAYALPLDDQRVRFSLETDGSDDAVARFALYDPLDEFFGYFELVGRGDAVDVIADEPGHWVVFVTEAIGGELAVQLAAGDEEPLPVDLLVPLPVQDVRRLVARQEAAGPLDVQLATRISTRPALAIVEQIGTATNLDIVVEGPNGVVYEVHAENANVTKDGPAELRGEHRAQPGNLAEGTYAVRATAEVFMGTIELVFKTYDRSGLPELDANCACAEEGDATMAEVLASGSLVAELRPLEPIEVDTAGGSALVFAGSGRVWAQILVYDASDQVVALVDLGEGEDDGRWQWEYPEDGNESVVMAELGLPRAGRYVLYLYDISNDAESVLVVVPGIFEAEVGRTLEVDETSVRMSQFQLAGSTGTEEATVRLAGGLVAVRVRSNDLAGTSRELTITGPLGPVLYHRQGVNALGASLDSSYEEHPERFSAGLFTIRKVSRAVAGDEEIGLLTYVRLGA